MQAAAPALGVRLQSVEIPRPPRSDELERALQTARDAESFVLAPGGFTIANRKRLIDMAKKQHRPVISAWKVFAEDGALFTYGPDIQPITQRLAVLLGKVLNGAKPTDLPIEQPTKFELVINLKTARALGLTIPPSLLARADEVIQ